MKDMDLLMRKHLLVTSLLVSLALIIAVLFMAQEAPVYSANATMDQHVYLPMINNRHDTILPSPVFGVQMYGSTRPNSEYYDALIDSGARWLRVAVTWSSVEPQNTTPDNYIWGAVDSTLAASLEGVKIIVDIEGNPEWAATIPRGPIDKVGLHEFTQFVGALVERYDGDGIDDAPGSPIVTHWEFYNEPDAETDAPNPKSWGDYGDKYAQMLTAVYPVVKAANPQAQVVIGGIAYDYFNTDEETGEETSGTFSPEFFEDVLKNGGGDYFDIMNFHIYPIVFGPKWSKLNGTGLPEKAQELRGILDDYGYGKKPVIITESGAHSSSNNSYPFIGTPELQSRYVAALFTQSMANDIDVMIWWALYDLGGGYWDNGLVRNISLSFPAQRKPSFTAYQTAVSQLSTAHFRRAWTLSETRSEDLEVYEFEDFTHNRKLYVAWLNPIDTNETRFIAIQAHQAVVRNIYGQEIVNITDSLGSILIEVGGQPVYIEVNQ